MKCRCGYSHQQDQLIKKRAHGEICQLMGSRDIPTQMSNGFSTALGLTESVLWGFMNLMIHCDANPILSS